MESVAVNQNKRVFWSQILKGLLMATSISLVAILLFALIIKFVGITDKLIMPINQVIKVVSIFMGVFVALKQNACKGWVKGMLIGMLYTVVAYILFSALSGAFAMNISLLNDILFGAIIGSICGVITVNLRK